MVSLVPSNLLTTQLSILCTLLLGWEHCRDLCWFLSLPGQGRRACEFKPLQQKKGRGVHQQKKTSDKIWSSPLEILFTSKVSGNGLAAQ